MSNLERSNNNHCNANQSTPGFVDLFARLLSDPVAQELLVSDPSNLMAEFQLSAAEQKAVLALDPNSLKTQSRTLVDKRWHEINKLIPRTLGNSDNDLREVFEYFAIQYWPSDFRRHLVDAYKFLQFLEKNEIALADSKEKQSLKHAMK